ncbi:PucR family transcriptional regulator [Amycolatopsis suaedae]|uniref:PucR family transcriptional regulator n=1 Tax=Amycolatopsis suaedae TaxID=2510978 RepID=A0A4Q7JGB7_9PSEU|nr:PucR family transcriptional regulator [Amycolatopsis suaedae]RZQ65804.1 PucR family transcriptional regulator [Amycolatopsis suaedae]
MVVRQWSRLSEVVAPVMPVPRPPRQRTGDGTVGLRPGHRELVLAFRGHADQVAAEVVAGVRRAVAEYRDVLDGPFGKVAAGAVRAVLEHGVDALVDPTVAREDWSGVVRGLGSVEFADGRSLDAVQEAFRIAGGLAGRRLWEFLRSRGASAEWTRGCADTVAARFDELALHCAEGYAAARAEAADGLDARRAQLLHLLTAEAPAGGRALADAARLANWPLPATVTVVALRAPDDRGAAAALPSAVLADLSGQAPCLVAPGDRLDAAGVAASLPGWRAAVGPVVPLEECPSSLRVARRALDLADRGVIPALPVVDCADHQLPLALFADEMLIDTLVDRHLAPLDTLAEAQQERLLVTLHEWLASRGRVAAVADRLQVHAQTVRYRMHKLEEVLGSSLDDPQHRFELEVAVRARLMRAGCADR